MLKITPPLETAQDYIDYLDDIYGKMTTSKKTVADVDNIWNKWDRQGTSKPTNMESVAAAPYDTFRSYFDDIMQACEIKNIDPNTVFFALVRIKNLNAFANTMPNSDRVIIFDGDLIAFFTTFIITTLQAVYSNPTEQETEDVEAFLLSTLNTFYGKEQSEEENEVYGNQFMTIIQKDYQLTEIGSYFSMAFTVFIICHELSHHILGHAEEKRMYVVPDVSQKRQDSIPCNTPAYEEEFEADAYGYQLFLELIEKEDQIESAKLSQAFNRAPLMFFDFIDIVELFGRKKGFYQQKSDTHPDPMARKKYLLSLYDKQLDAEGDELYKGFTGFIDHIKKQLS